MLFLVSDALSFRCRIKNGEYKSAHSFWRGAEQSGITMEWTARVAPLQVCVSSESDVFFKQKASQLVGSGSEMCSCAMHNPLILWGKWRLTTSKRKCVRVCFHDLAKKDDV